MRLGVFICFCFRKNVKCVCVFVYVYVNGDRVWVGEDREVGERVEREKRREGKKGGGKWDNGYES